MMKMMADNIIPSHLQEFTSAAIDKATRYDGSAPDNAAIWTQGQGHAASSLRGFLSNTLSPTTGGKSECAGQEGASGPVVHKACFRVQAKPRVFSAGFGVVR